jgi:hypothetical protein
VHIQVVQRGFYIIFMANLSGAWTRKALQDHPTHDPGSLRMLLVDECLGMKDAVTASSHRHSGCCPFTDDDPTL